MTRFRELLAECLRRQASDLHLTVGAAPFVRVFGQLAPVDDQLTTQSQLDEIVAELTSERQRVVLAEHQSLDLAYSPESNQRFRVNVFRQRGQLAMAVRRLDNQFKDFHDLHLPPQIAELADLRHGLVLVTGATGSGKTTTLATLLHQINRARSCHIITIEDPIEYVHQNQQSLVHQREVHNDVPSFADAVRSALREDPDVILVGEMRDTETMRAAITAAETGHLVFSTLHTGDAVGALERMLGVFPAEVQPGMRHKLSMVLRAVVAQQLLPRSDGTGRIPAVEIMCVDNAIANQIRTGKFEQIYATIETGSSAGMQTMEHSLAQLVSDGWVDLDAAMRAARKPNLVQSRLRLAAPLNRYSHAATQHATFT